jgi:Ricin-type beta-trefoil lectin domain-like
MATYRFLTHPGRRQDPASLASPETERGSRSRLRRRGLMTRAVLAGAGLAGVASVMLASTGVASATVDQTTSQYAELGPLAYTGDQASQVTAVYTIQNLAEPNDLLLEDHGNQMNNGALTDVWDQTDQGSYQDPTNDGNYPQITQANELWEFVPSAGNTGGQITTGWGELINRQSGLCLDVNGSDPNEYGDGATVDQWTCGGGPNQEWTSLDLNEFPGGSGYTLEPQSDNGAGDLGVGNSTCNPQGDGDQVYVRTTGQADNSCDEWNIAQASYDFATYPIYVPDTFNDNDGRTYDCLAGDNLRLSADSGPGNWFYDYADLSTTTNLDYLDIQEFAPSNSNPNALVGSPPAGPSLNYYNTGGGGAGYTGQIMLYCDPGSTNP